MFFSSNFRKNYVKWLTLHVCSLYVNANCEFQPHTAFAGARRFASCNHQRSLDFMHHTINYRKVVPVGYECTSWKDFLDGKCAECGPDTKRCAIMGIRADEYKQFRNTSIQHMMYLKTSGTKPYWRKIFPLYFNSFIVLIKKITIIFVLLIRMLKVYTKVAKYFVYHNSIYYQSPTIS